MQPSKEQFIETYISDVGHQKEICSELMCKEFDQDWLIQEQDAIEEITKATAEAMASPFAVTKENQAKYILKILERLAVKFYQRKIEHIIEEKAYENYNYGDY